MNLIKLLCGGRNFKLFYHIHCLFISITPRILFRSRLKSTLAQLEKRPDKDYIVERVNYYCQNTEQPPLLSQATHFLPPLLSQGGVGGGGENQTPNPDPPTTSAEQDCLRSDWCGVNCVLKEVKIADFSPALFDCSVVYYYDAMEYLRWFDENLRFNIIPGDVTHIPQIPAFVKSRPIHPNTAPTAQSDNSLSAPPAGAGNSLSAPPAPSGGGRGGGNDNSNSILLNLNKLRHFVFVNDNIPFREKKDSAIFRGAIWGKQQRMKLFSNYFGHPLCDLGATTKKNKNYPAEWNKKNISIYEHLKYKFIFAIEGNDVASNLKWIMSSNSIAVMPAPSYETWFMEGKLIPDYHYIQIEKDFSDVETKLKYYIDNPEKAEEIIKNANHFVTQFLDKKREKLISLLVLDKYFHIY